MRNPALKSKKPSREKTLATCICGAVELEIDFPAFWAWHDHSKASRRAQGSAYVTYIGTWKSRFRVKKGAKNIRRFDDETAKGVRGFCAICGTPLTYERASAPKWVNIPRALFEARTGREPRYHIRLEESPEWAYLGAKLVPLKNYPGVMWERPKQKKRTQNDHTFHGVEMR